MEEARGLAELLKQGWKPDRTIIYCFWDGEERAFWGPPNGPRPTRMRLKTHAVAYINSDGNGAAIFVPKARIHWKVSSIAFAKDIEDPETKMTAWKRAHLADIERAAPAKRADSRSRPDTRIAALGSGSDYTVFTDHLGIASLNIGFGGEDARRRPISLHLR